MTKSILIHNGKIWGVGGKYSSWMTFDPSIGYITDLGTGTGPVSEFQDYARIDFGGKLILPGFHESHIHLQAVGVAKRTVIANGSKSVEEFQGRIKTFVEKFPEKIWIKGRGWDQDAMGRYPDRFDLDQVCPDKPVAINRVCGHLNLVNSKALEILGFNKDTPNPPGGHIDKFPDGHKNAGEPTGILREKAMGKLDPYLALDNQEHLKCIQEGIKECMKYGVTSAHSNEGEAWKEFCQAADQGMLLIRIFMAAYFATRNSGNFPKAGESHGPMLSCDRTKIFADGSLGGATAALSIPYKDSENKGLLLQSQEEMDALVKEATVKGFRLEIHVIGDAAADASLTAIEKAKVTPEKRPLLTHCQFLRPDLIDRMKKAGVIANIQPQFVCTDAECAEKTIPQQLLECSYPWKTLWEKGIICAGGSDSPVEPPNPLLGIYDAVFRPHSTREQPQNKIFRPSECLDIHQAIELYTKNGAYTTRRENDLGQLLPGYFADFIVLDKDICENPGLCLSAKVEEVWVAGVKQVLE